MDSIQMIQAAHTMPTDQTIQTVRLIDRLVTDEINRRYDITDWRQVRMAYGRLSFSAFLSMILMDTGFDTASPEDPLEYAAAHGFISSDTEEYLTEAYLADDDLTDANLTGPGGNAPFISRCMNVLPPAQADSISRIYQSYLAQDYSVAEGAFLFRTGKNHRDVLGSYYTPEQLADTIARLALDRWLSVQRTAPPRVLDPSCGGGEFLLAVLKNLRGHGISPTPAQMHQFCGCDVDPTAVLITRYRLAKACGSNICQADIRLGNPLCTPSCESKALAEQSTCRFALAMEGRYYASTYGILACADTLAGADMDEHKRSLSEEFDIIVGNPPWEKVRFEEKKFLRPYADYDQISQKDRRRDFVLHASKANRAYYNALQSDYASYKKRAHQHPLLQISLTGELNTYALFTELSARLVSRDGQCALIVKASLVKMPVYSELLAWLTKSGGLYEVDLFSNRNRIFRIDSREEFALICLKGSNSCGRIGVRFNLDNISELSDDTLLHEMPVDFLHKVNPRTGMFPSIRDSGDIAFLDRIYTGCPCFEEAFQDCHYGRLVHFTNHAQHIRRAPSAGYIPVYEGKFIERYTGKFATYAGIPEAARYSSKASARRLADPHGGELPEARYFIEEGFWKQLSRNMPARYSVMWRSLTSATNYRTMLATILPSMPTSQSIQLLQTDSDEDMLLILSLFNSVIFDYIVRIKMVGLDLTQTIIRQIPVPPRERYDEVFTYQGIRSTLKEHVISRIRRIYADEDRLDGLFDSASFYELHNDKMPKQLSAELDQLTGYAYKLQTQEVRHIAASFVHYYTAAEIGEWF